MKIRTLTCVFVLLLASVCTHAKLIPFRGDNGKWGFKMKRALLWLRQRMPLYTKVVFLMVCVLCQRKSLS